MSVIRKKPFIESVIESLTDEQKASLLSVMNGSEATVNASFTDLPEDDVAPVLFQLEPNNLKTGILIQGSTYDVLLAYHRFQDMQIYNLDLSKFTFEKINEYLDINELRRIMFDGNIVNIVNDAIEDGDITAGTEVVANPTLAGTEASLTGLQVGNAKYKVDGGSDKLYLHNISWNLTSIYGYTLSSSGAITQKTFCITKSPTPLTSLKELCDAMGFVENGKTWFTICSSSKTITYTSSSSPAIIESAGILYCDVNYGTGGGKTLKNRINLNHFDFSNGTINSVSPEPTPSNFKDEVTEL